METVYDRKEKIWRGPKTQSSGDFENNVAEKCIKVLMKDPDHIAQICYPSGKEYTNREIAEMSILVAQHFRDELKMSQGDIFGLCAVNTDYVVPLFFGGLLAGLAISPVHPELDKDGIKHLFSLTKPSIMFCDGDKYSVIKEVIHELDLNIKIYTVKGHIQNVPCILEFLQERFNLDTFKAEVLKEGHNQTAALLCSSGTTGQPKAVCISHATLLRNSSRRLDLKAALSFSPLNWFTGVSQVIMCAAHNVTNVCSERPFSNNAFFDIVKKYKIEMLIAPPSQLSLLASDPRMQHSDITCIKAIKCRGSSVPLTLIENLKAYLPRTAFSVGYGLTEAGGCSACLATKENCVGKLLPNIEGKIIDESGQLMGPNEQGEICMKTPYPWAGYYNNPEATAITYINGWIHTGDIGYFDDEDNLFCVDRKKEILKCNSFHVSPTEIESLIYKIKGVAETCVFGIPDVIQYNLLAAAVVLTPGCQLTAKEIIDYVAAHAAEYKQLCGGVYIVDTLPKTTTGKVIRRQVFKLYQQMHLN